MSENVSIDKELNLDLDLDLDLELEILCNKRDIVIDVKYKKYSEQYKYAYSKIYWGLGIENELYLEFDKKEICLSNDLLNKTKKERYSLDYYANYKPDILLEAKNYYINNYSINDCIEVPVLLNSHSFTKTDKYNQPKLNYTKNSEINNLFWGKTLLESLQLDNNYFIKSAEYNWLFDGDSIEFNTIHFLNTNLPAVLLELDTSKDKFIYELNNSFSNMTIFNDFGKIKIMEQNHAFATYCTNLGNISMFNNGTLHFNLTLPTELNEKGEIKDREQFVKYHSRAIRLIQWIEPLLIAVYGSSDFFSTMNGFSRKTELSAASQRGIVSRYIGIGTYDATLMKSGKILTVPIKECIGNENDFWWYHRENGYVQLEEVGMDINFNKHYNHGIELRFLDHISDKEQLTQCFEFIIHLMDFVLDSEYSTDFIGIAALDKIWNDILWKCMIQGKSVLLEKNEINMFEHIFKIKLHSQTVEEVYNELFIFLITKYNKISQGLLSFTKSPTEYILFPNGEFSRLALKPQIKRIDFLPFSMRFAEYYGLKIPTSAILENKYIDISVKRCCNIT